MANNKKTIRETKEFLIIEKDKFDCIKDSFWALMLQVTQLETLIKELKVNNVSEVKP